MMSRLLRAAGAAAGAGVERVWGSVNRALCKIHDLDDNTWVFRKRDHSGVPLFRGYRHFERDIFCNYLVLNSRILVATLGGGVSTFAEVMRSVALDEQSIHRSFRDSGSCCNSYLPGSDVCLFSFHSSRVEICDDNLDKIRAEFLLFRSTAYNMLSSLIGSMGQNEKRTR